MPSAPSSRHGLWPLLLLLGCAVVALAWATLSAHTGATHGWMALVAAAEAAWMLSLGGLQAGRLRALVACLATVTVVLLANVLLTSLLTGQLMGLGLADALLRTGTSLATVYALIRTGMAELAWTLLALLLAWRLAR